KVPGGGAILSFLKSVARAAAHTVGPASLKCQLRAHGFCINIVETPIPEDDQIRHAVVKSRERGTQMPADPLLIHQLIRCDLLRLDVLKSRVAQLEEIRRAKGRSVERLERGPFERTVDQSQARIERGIEIAVLI